MSGTNQTDLFSEEEEQSLSVSMSLPAGSRNYARTSRLLASKKVLRLSVQAYGQNSVELLTKYDPSTRLWKTSQLSLVEQTGDGLEEFLETWPRSGMTRNGIAYRLPTLVAGNFGTEFGLWPSPNATAFKGGRLSPRVGVKSPERNNWQDWCSLQLGQRYPNPETAEQVMGYLSGHTEIKQSETQ